MEPQGLHPHEFHGIIAVSRRMVELFEVIRRAARADCTVLIVGETGTGKELVARALHAESPRRRGAFIGVNCAAFSPALLESELFGHAKGAFTGAVTASPGVFRAASGGTLFLDEVADMPLELQAKLLRVIQEQTVKPIGTARPVPVDVRVISATNKPLAEEVASGRFRLDLSYRIRVVPLSLPPLRERPGDIEALLWHFIAQQHAARRIERIAPAALEAIRTYRWPGNIRELHSVVEYACIMGEGPTLELADVPEEVRREGPAGPRGDTDELERARILQALAAHGGHRERTAAALGMSRTTLWRKLSMHGLRRG